MTQSIKKKLSAVFAAFVLAFATLALPVAISAPVNAQNAVQDGINAAQGDGVPGQDLFNGENSIFRTVVNILLFVIGAICVIMLIWGGIRYTTSGGNSASVTAAKNTILYAIIGLIIAFLAFAIVNWVLGAVTPTA
ncbi:MAG: pilin [Candidatus Microsaccharimonas sp.]